jgi:hypothetical protein
LLLFAALIAGAATAIALIAIFLGAPFAVMRSTDVMTFGVKLAFTASLLLLTGYLLHQAARPGQEPRRAIRWIAAPFVLVAVLAVIGLSSAPPGATGAQIFGATWQTCLLSVSVLSIPVYGLVALALRRLAPTDLKLAGLLAGLASGSTAALAYSLHCPETSAAFLLVWYGSGIALAGLAGRAAGPFLLRW